MRRFLDFVRNMTLTLGFFIISAAYILAAATMATVVINDFQLDTYVTLNTGIAAVIFVVLTIWPPIIMLWFARLRVQRVRNDVPLDRDYGSW